MKKVFAVAAAIMLLCLGGIAQATVAIDTVAVGDAGNAADTTGYGAVDHNYNIGKYEVTVGQYTEFLNYKEWDAATPQLMPLDAIVANHIERNGSGTTIDPYIYSVASEWANNPVSYVSFWDACRFVNWLGNGQGDGDTESGAYPLNGYNDSAGGDISRNPGAIWVLPTIDEWYKAAYYRGGTNAGYYDQPTASAYGTVNQYGNGWEWSESVVSVGSVAGRILGGGYGLLDEGLPVDFKGSSLGDPSKSGGPSLPWGYEIPVENIGFGFRVASVPEPSSIIALLGGMISLLGIRRRKGRMGQ